MAVLTEQDRVDIWADFQRRNEDAFGAVTKTDIRAAVDALDAYLETNKAVIIASVPQPARAELTGGQIARLLASIMDKRFVRGS